MSTGSQECLTRCFEMLLNPEDSLLVETPTYSGSLAFLKPYGCHLAGVPTDSQGLVPSELESILNNWEAVSSLHIIMIILYVGCRCIRESLSLKYSTQFQLVRILVVEH